MAVTVKPATPKAAPLDVARFPKDFPTLAHTVHRRPPAYLATPASSQKQRQVIDAMSLSVWRRRW